MKISPILESLPLSFEHYPIAITGNFCQYMAVLSSNAMQLKHIIFFYYYY